MSPTAKRLLLITANFPPTNAVDMHRVRLSLPHYRQFGFEPEVLCFRPECVDHPEDPLLCESVNDDVPVHRVACLSARWTRSLGIGAVGFRGLPALRSAGLKLIAQRRPDIILFSTTSFPLFALGPAFRRASGAPYVLDFQDPWVSPEGTTLRPSLKNRFVQYLHRQLEPRAVRHAGGLMAVSPAYLEVLNRRYPSVAGLPQAVIPFGSAETDLEIARRHASDAIAGTAGESGLGELHRDLETRTVGLYAGAYVQTMEPMVSAFFASIKAALAQQPDMENRFRAWFVGSQYAASCVEKPFQRLAERWGVAAVVREHPARIPYYQSLGVLCRSSFNLLFGSTSAGYNPSKLFTLLLAQRPVLAFVSPNTIAEDLLHRAGGAVTIPVLADAPDADRGRLIFRFLSCGKQASELVPAPNQDFLQRHSSRAATQRQAALLEQVIERELPATDRSCTIR